MQLDCRNYSAASGGVAEAVRGGCVWYATRPLAQFLLERIAQNPDMSVLELGAGTGVVGLFVAQATTGQVVLTDGTPAVLKLLELNVAINKLRNASVKSLKWGELLSTPTVVPTSPLKRKREDSTQAAAAAEDVQFDMVVASDCLYQEEDASALWESAAGHLSDQEGAVFILAHQERRMVVMNQGIVSEEETDSVLSAFVQLGSKRGFEVEEPCFTKVGELEDPVRILVFTRR